MWEHILAALGGGLQGAAQGYETGKDLELKEKQIATREEIERFKNETRALIAQMVEAGKNTRHENPSGNTLANVAGANERNTATIAGQNYRHDTPSGTAVLQEGGRNARHDDAIDLGYNRLFQDDTLSRYLHDTPSGNARLSSQTQRYTHDNASGNARLGAQVDLRGQDISSADRRYGVDVGATTTRRGQDLTAGTAAAAEQGRNTRFTQSEQGRDRRSRERFGINLNPTGEQPTVPTTPARAPIPVTPRSQSMSTIPLEAAPQSSVVREPGTPPPVQEPVAPEPSATPAPPASPDAKTERVTRIATELQGKVQAFTREADPTKKRALQADIARLKQQLLDARTK